MLSITERLRFLFLFCLLELLGVTTSSRLAIARSQQFHYASFTMHKFSYLNVAKIANKTVPSYMDCAFECLENPGCFSYNVEASVQRGKTTWCELLSSDKYNFTNELSTNYKTDHYSMWSPCSLEPCKNGATCVANYKDDTYSCLCAPDFIGKHCETVCNVSDGWKMFDESCYKFFAELKNWSEAEQHCKLLNASLVEIHSQEEDAFLKTIISNHPAMGVYIGANDIDKEGVWVWVNSGNPLGYSNWRPGQPDNSGHGENCGTKDPSSPYEWNDLSCYAATSFICESNADG